MGGIGVTSGHHERRSHQIAEALAATRTRIADAALRAGRDPADIHLVVVTKTRPVSDVAILASLGARDLGENRHQEAEQKAKATQALGLHWHFIGQIQSNKAARIARYAATVHGVDSAKTVRRLESGAADHGRSIGCFIQVSLDPPGEGTARGGVEAAGVGSLADLVSSAGALRLLGVMGVAPLYGDPRVAFDQLAGVSESLRADHPGATAISAGMSGDFEAAVEHGATHVRIGALILGERPPLG
jgi:pyridoxal phosphate enzyme (YggS family)